MERVLAGDAGCQAPPIASAEAMRAEARNYPAPRENREYQRLMQLPEVRQHLNAMLIRHYTAWLESKLPALGERTPHEAVRDHDGREAVAALDARRSSATVARQSPPLDAEAPAMLRRELGLHDGRRARPR